MIYFLINELHTKQAAFVQFKKKHQTSLKLMKKKLKIPIQTIVDKKAHLNRHFELKTPEKTHTHKPTDAFHHVESAETAIRSDTRNEHSLN